MRARSVGATPIAPTGRRAGRTSARQQRASPGAAPPPPGSSSPASSRAGKAAAREADAETWALYASLVRPLPGRRRPVPAAQPAPAQGPDAPVAEPAPRPVPTPRAAPRPAAPPPLAIGAEPPGVDRATFKRLRSGRLGAARTLDLHGLTAQRAFHVLALFLRTAQAEHLRCVEVITGRGSTETGGVIRRELPLWLNRPDLRGLVLAAVHPHPANPGAVRLLLRRPR